MVKKSLEEGKAMINRKLLVKGVAVIAIMTVGLSFGQARGTDRAGTASFPSKQSGIVIPIIPPMPNACYAVSVQQTNTAGYSPIASCTYFNVLHKDTTQFEVQHKTCQKGVPKALKSGVSLDWQLSASAIVGGPCGTCGSGSYHEHCGASGCNLVCVDDSISDGACTSDSNCGSGLPLCVGTDTCGSTPQFCYRAC